MRKKILKLRSRRSFNNHLLSIFNKVERDHWWWEGRRWIINFYIRRYKPSSVLDVGCGTGETLSSIRRKFPRIKLFGLDKSKLAVSYCKKRGFNNILLGVAEKLPFRNEKFDCLLLLDVLEHIENDSLALGEAKRVLRPNGFIIITAPALDFLYSTHDYLQGHKRRYYLRRIVELARSNNLKICKLTYFNFFLSPVIIFFRILSFFPPFRFLGKFDNSINYNIAHNKVLNSILKFIFINEVRLTQFLRYPWGISILAVLRKED